MTAPASSRRKRVPALPPEDRRAALIRATIPLLEQHGMAVTTRQIADAAGVAEGTIFGVFPDKASLIQAAIIEAFAPDEAIRVLAGMAEIADLRRRIAAIVDVLNRGTTNRIRLLMAVRSGVGRAPDQGEGLAPKLVDSREQVLQAVTNAIKPDAHLLRLSPAATARVVMTMVFASQGGGLGEVEPIESADLSSLLLDGLLAPDPPAPAPPASSADPTPSPGQGAKPC